MSHRFHFTVTINAESVGEIINTLESILCKLDTILEPSLGCEQTETMEAQWELDENPN